MKSGFFCVILWKEKNMDLPSRHIPKNSNAFSSYWNTEKPNYLAHHLSPQIKLEAAQQMVPYYYEADAIGDAVALEFLIKKGFQQGMKELHQMLATYPLNKETYSSETQLFLEQIFSLPEWLDTDLLQKGSNFCNRTGTSGLATLRNYCLMGGYESSAINKPLIFTGALKKGAVKRLSDTVVFWINVTAQDGMKIKEKGFFSAVTTRLIHSYSRIMIERQPDWKTQDWGRPLNTWDMLATNLGFSIVFLDGLQKLGLKPTKEEISGVLHLWKYIGYLIGIPEHLLADTETQAADALFLWSKTQKGADEDSISLAYSLYEEPQRVTFTKSQYLKNFVQFTNLGYNNFLLGKESCKKLGLPYTKAIRWVKFITMINSLQQKAASMHPMLYRYMIRKGNKEQLNVLKLYKKQEYHQKTV